MPLEVSVITKIHYSFNFFSEHSLSGTEWNLVSLGDIVSYGVCHDTTPRIRIGRCFNSLCHLLSYPSIFLIIISLLLIELLITCQKLNYPIHSFLSVIFQLQGNLPYLKIMHLSKPVEYTTLTVNPKVNFGFVVIMMGRWRLISYNKGQCHPG